MDVIDEFYEHLDKLFYRSEDLGSEFDFPDEYMWVVGSEHPGYLGDEFKKNLATRHTHFVSTIAIFGPPFLRDTEKYSINDEFLAFFEKCRVKHQLEDEDIYAFVQRNRSGSYYFGVLFPVQGDTESCALLKGSYGVVKGTKEAKQEDV